MMKLIVIFLIAFPFVMSAQMTYIPDDNFEQALIDKGYDSGPLTDSVPTKNIDKISYLHVRGKSIADLRGIEDFKALDTLDCAYNSLTSLNVSKNTSLKFLQCDNNFLNNLDVSNNSSLEILQCGYNQLTNLDISKAVNLKEIRCEYNKLTKIDLSENIKLTSLLCYENKLTNLEIGKNSKLVQLSCFDNQLKISLDLSKNPSLKYMYAYNNPNLYCIQVINSTDAYNNGNWHKDKNAIYSEDCVNSGAIPYTYIPDDNFEQKLIALGYDSGNINDSVLTLNIENLTSLNISKSNIRDLTGIEDFKALDTLECGDNHITRLDLRKNTSLEILECANNNISSLNISANYYLKFLACNDNKLTGLNLRKNPVLEFLYANNNPNLFCIRVIDSTDAYNNSNWYKDFTAIYSEDCDYPGVIDYTYIPDDNFEQALIDLGYDSGPLNDSVLTANIKNVHALNIGHKHISDLTGIEDFKALDTLDCSNQNLTNLNVSKNTSLKFLNCCYNFLNKLDASKNSSLETLMCGYNQLTNLDISNAINLKEIRCEYNRLTKLDLSQKSKLYMLYCSHNQILNLDLSENTNLTQLIFYNNMLTKLDLSNNSGLTVFSGENNRLSSLNVSKNISLKWLECSKNQLTGLDVTKNTSLELLKCTDNRLSSLDLSKNPELRDFDSRNNPNLSCIQVDSSFGNMTYWKKDTKATYSEDCRYSDKIHYTYIPDDIFEQAMIDLGYDSGPLNDSIPTMNIEAISSLSINSHNISDLTGIEDFVALDSLECSNNKLTNLDISYNIDLKVLNCSGNQLTGLDVINNYSLIELYCKNNRLSNLNINQNMALKFLDCSGNELPNLDLSKNYNLKEFDCSNNRLANLYIRKNTLLKFLACNNNMLTSLDLSMNPDLEYLYVNNNPNLFCIQVVDSADANNNSNWHKDPTAIYSEGCGYWGAIHYTYVPDDIFEQWLIYLGYDSGPLNDSVPTSNIMNVYNLTIRTTNLKDLTGIEDFKALNELDLEGNELTCLDLSMNTSLRRLNCSYNRLTYLNVSKNVSLANLNCAGNQLTSLDVSNNTSLGQLNCNNNKITNLNLRNAVKLYELLCARNQLTNLDLSDNTSLGSLDCTFNQLLNLDLSNNTNLVNLRCYENQLSNLDLSNNTNLGYLGCGNNQLYDLDLSRNTFLGTLSCNGNQLRRLDLSMIKDLNAFWGYNNKYLSCIQVKDPSIAAINPNWHKDPFVSYSEDCGPLSVYEYQIENNNILVSPNPASDYIEINVGNMHAYSLQQDLKIYNSLGECLMNLSPAPSEGEGARIDVSQLAAGVYFVMVGDKVSKFIKI